ncbi:hypothetical protein SAMN05421752_109188 [Natronorubrum thiooxidans]|uniref:Uncharacterized protein n=1 Tax=Natronorubrum thiooxidans TaxID=308853 RepID=A0A1N7G3H6_9EURY|nr:hypothetical protein SAMN05421752_109188 [Natronorubrum thiooxidans]
MMAFIIAPFGPLNGVVHVLETVTTTAGTLSNPPFTLNEGCGGRVERSDRDPIESPVTSTAYSSRNAQYSLHPGDSVST